MVPGEAFGTEHHVRISYATSMKELERGLDRIHKFIEQRSRCRRQGIEPRVRRTSLGIADLEPWFPNPAARHGEVWFNARRC